MKHIGFIGASGLMGHGIARNLLAKGFAVSLTVHKNREGVADLLAAGAKLAGTAAELGACDAVMLCVTGSPQVEAALSGPDGVLSNARAGLVVIDCSTSEPESTQRLAALCAQHGATLVDAPLARTPVEAELGKLNTMVGAKAGADVQQLVNVISAGAVNSGIFQAMAKTLNGTYDGLKFELDNARKDLRYYTHLAEMVNVPSHVGEAVHQSLATASNLGYGKKYVPPWSMRRKS